jgi:hypothetical protein
MLWRKLRMMAVVALCGGTLFQATGCEAFIAPILSSIVTSVIAGAVSSMFAVT